MLEQTGTAKKLTGQILENWLVALADGHGGIQTIEKTGTSGLVDTYTITYADTTTSTFTVKNGKAISSITQYWAVSASNSTVPSQWYTTRQTMTVTNKYLWSYMHYAYNDGTSYDTPYSVIGVYGDTGAQTYVWIKYSAVFPTSDADMADIPDKWIGIYVGLSSTAPTSYTAYTWYQYKGEKGDTGDASEVTAQSVTYLEGTSGTVVPEGSWTTTVPSVTPGNYLWTRTQLTFNDNTSITAYSVSRFGIDGTGSVSSVNNQSPDTNGNVALTASNIPTSDSESVQGKLDASATVEELATYTRPNLLDNWYFVGGGSQLGYGTFPINQRGQTTYSGNGHYIDRWIGGSGVVVALDYLTIKAGEWLVQNIASFETLIGKQLTATLLLADNTLLTGTAIITTAGGQLVRLIGTDNIYVYTVNSPSNKGFGIHVYNTDINVVAVKLELGSTQTLAHQEGSTWVLNEVPDYAIEFMKCEAYLWVLDFPFNYAKCSAVGITGTTTDSCRVILQPPVQMRAKSALVSMVGGPVNVKSVNSQARIAGFSWANCTGNTIALAPILNTAFSSNEAVLYMENETSTAKIIISVE